MARRRIAQRRRVFVDIIVMRPPRISLRAALSAIRASHGRTSQIANRFRAGSA